MRIRLILAITVGLLFCTLATLEFPELLNLSDDTSNDYSLAIFQSSRSGTVREQTPELLRGARVKNPKRERFVTHVQFPAPSPETTDYLRLLCVQRI